MDKPDFSGLSDFDLILLRHATVEAGFEEDKEFVRAVDEELRIRVKSKEENLCSHGWEDWDNCPVCGH